MILKNLTCKGMACFMAFVMLISASASAVFDGTSSNAAAAPEAVYEFDHTKTAVSQLEDLFTTIDIMDATAFQLSDEMEKGNVTSEQLVRMYIDRINAYDKKEKLNSIISINPGALEEARKLDEERAAGKVRGPLHGIPVLVKDNYDLKGTATTAGSLSLAGFISEKDSFVVKKLKAAGAVVIAKANLSEFAKSAYDSHSLIGGNVHNPYDVTRSPAGSSGGTAVAVACNFAVIGFGTDTGGSIRNPSSWCNLYGIRPSKGLTSIDGVVPLITYFDTTGPIARTAEDMALGLEMIAGTDPDDDYTQEADADGMVQGGYTGFLSKDGLKGKRIGYLSGSFVKKDLTGVNDDNTYIFEVKEPDLKVTQMVKRTRADLRKAGATFVDMSDLISDDSVVDAYIDYSRASLLSTMEYDTNRYLHGHGENAPFKTLKELIKTGKYGIDYTNLSQDPIYIENCADSFEETVNPYTLEVNGYKRFKTWDRVLSDRASLEDLMNQKDVDAIMFLHDTNIPVHDIEDSVNDWLQVSENVNGTGDFYARNFGVFYGCPDMVLPMGFSETDENCSVPMPVGMHFVGKYGDEKTLMQIAYAYEQQAGPDIRRMPEIAPALKDQNLNAYLETLMDEVYSIDYSVFAARPEGKTKLMEKAYDRAAAADRSDPYAVYEAAYDLAREYDKTIEALKASGINLTKADVELSGTQFSYTGSPITPEVKATVGGVTLNKDQDYKVEYQNNLNAGTAAVTVLPASSSFAGSKTESFTIKKGRTSFKVKASKKKIRVSELKKKKCTFTIKVTGLSKGSSKVGFTINKVTNGQKARVKVNSKTGRVTIKKKTKKCVIQVKVTSKANKNRKEETKTIKIPVG